MSKEKKINLLFAKRFRSVRETANLTQKELSEKLFVTPAMVSYYESATKRITPQIAHSMSIICGINENYLLDEDVEYPTQSAQAAAVLSQSSRENVLLHTALLALFKLNGYDVTVNEVKSNCEVTEALKAINEHLKINDQVTLSLDETNNLGNALNDMFVMLLRRYYNLEN